MIQTLEAGVDWLTDRVPERVTLCNARGVRDTPVAEWVLAMLLAHGKGLFEAAERRTWKYWQPRELAGSTVLIVGHGSIGAALGRRLEALDAHVVGVAGRARDGLYGPESLPELLGRADSVVVLAPLTAQTRGFVDGEFLARMRDGALFVNAGRGRGGRHRRAARRGRPAPDRARRHRSGAAARRPSAVEGAGCRDQPAHGG